MQILRKGLLSLAVMAGLVASQSTVFAQQISGPTCINYVAPLVPTDPPPAQTQYTYTFTPQNPGDVFVGWGQKGDVEVVSTSGTATAASYTATFQSTGYGRGEVRAYYSTNGCYPAEVRYPVNKLFTKLDNSKLTAPDCVQGGSTYAFTVPPIISSSTQIGQQIGVDTYAWDSFPTGSQVAFSGDGSAATVTLPANFSGNFTVGVIIGACNAGNPAKKMTKTISSRPSTPVIAVSAGTTSCKIDLSPFTITYQVQANVDYRWRIPSGWQISPLGANVGTGISYPTAGTQTVTITPINTNADNVSVTAKFPNGTGCGTSEVASNLIQVSYQLTSANTINISNNSTCLTPGSSVNLSVGGTSSNTSIQWGLPQGWSITSGNINDNAITVSVGTGSGNITASAVGCPGTVSRAVTVSGAGNCNPANFEVERGSGKYFFITDLLNPNNPSPTCLPDGQNANPSPITYIWTAGTQQKTMIGGGPEVLFNQNVPAGTTVTVRIQNTINCLDYTLTGNALRPLSNRQPSAALQQATSLSSYPNPAKDELSVDLTLPAGSEAQLLITDMLGRTVQQSTTRQAHTELNVSRLPKGTYLLRAVLSDGKSISQKIQVQR